jgi:hypothetical protein
MRDKILWESRNVYKIDIEILKEKWYFDTHIGQLSCKTFSLILTLYKIESFVLNDEGIKSCHPSCLKKLYK